MKKETNSRFKYALRFIKRQEDAMRSDSLANKLRSKNLTDFWREVKQINKCSTPLPTKVEGVSGADKITNLWKNHYSDLFNCIQCNTTEVCYDVEFCPEIIVSVEEIQKAIVSLDNNKSCGADNIYAEHLKYASTRVLTLLSLCMTGFLVHGALPDSMLSVILVPVIKSKTGRISSKDNYRPIALASVVSKVLEIVLMLRLEACLVTSVNRFGFKRKHGTDMCIYALKETILKYRCLNASMFLCFLDASKAFDRINHAKLFLKLVNRGVPGYIVRIMIYWYSNQRMAVRWGNTLSDTFTVSNGVRQCGILSPYLFNVYMDDLSSELNSCETGCVIGSAIVNHAMYADDLVVFSPCSSGLTSLLEVCEKFGAENDVLYNPRISKVR